VKALENNTLGGCRASKPARGEGLNLSRGGRNNRKKRMDDSEIKKDLSSAIGRKGKPERKKGAGHPNEKKDGRKNRGGRGRGQ